LDPGCADLMTKVQKLIDSTNHRPFDVKSDAHQEFLKKLLSEVYNLKQELPEANFSEELDKINSQIS
ncbi:hypothetical protein JYU23_01205, partial [bacterium AH-315-C07]|nr:hypothetical protein [bacterium AH-315-C07]